MNYREYLIIAASIGMIIANLVYIYSIYIKQNSKRQQNI